ncbi:tRNA (adenine(22)-N(1))-methyltransferase [Fructilactobacillus fructivorans]|uniref:Putative tRNA-m1A22 methylase n=1 Tax=Fructilactobacillus fructivorans TaxID=1614 RepID=A0A0C1Q3Y6_9LACO|nr:class I SAM-dependent methyltransferase [Fructilactobacillus fructivorans]KID42613.1 putative tRNA-m1A22 methylase [Fructilactobacillus fructivorans]KRK58689.1 hypothetical protein FC73_GL000244 [Fructilactobacillus fructivorans]KRN13599.1 hypothetical protein IV37_GL000322 [Fructilactobacillus fructivorans]KRN40243.1 hypothetical protein IV51_GL000425 [Fructilactobacillus fructivorans]KRN43424.1 hypothetical protein IV48_GL000029 [Fructilactobacillus fructivorans]
MTAKKLSPRLQAVSDLVPNGSIMADIGSDHAYVPAYLLKRDLIKYAIAGEVAPGPLKNATSEMEEQHLTDKMTTRLGDGLDVINPDDHVNAIVIAGMGGELITQILERGKHKLTDQTALILQPNVDEIRLRRWLVSNQYGIKAENIVFDAGHFYEMMLAKPVVKRVEYSKQELRFGPVLLKQKNPEFIDKWTDRIRKNKVVLNNLNNATNPPLDKIRHIQKINAELKEILNDHS